VQGVRITASRDGKIVDLVSARGNVVGNPQSRNHVNAPGSAEIAERSQIRVSMLWHTKPSQNFPRACSMREDPLILAR
jgi:hypothetical protein